MAAELRVRERSVQRWRRTWLTGGADALRSKGPASLCRLDEAQLDRLEAELGRGPLAHGWEDQRWTLSRIRQVIITVFHVEYTVPGVWYLLQRNGWSCQMGSRRAVERDDGAVEVWKKETWPRVKGPRRPATPGSSSKMSPASR